MTTGKALAIGGGALAVYFAWCWWRDRHGQAGSLTTGIAGGGMTLSGRQDTTYLGDVKTGGLVAPMPGSANIRPSTSPASFTRVARDAFAAALAPRPPEPAPTTAMSTEVQGVVVQPTLPRQPTVSTGLTPIRSLSGVVSGAFSRLL